MGLKITLKIMTLLWGRGPLSPRRVFEPCHMLGEKII